MTAAYAQTVMEDVVLADVALTLEWSHSGFPVEPDFADWTMWYRLSEPVVDLHRRDDGVSGLAAMPAPSVFLATEDAPRLVFDLNLSSSLWAGAVLDNSLLIITSSRANDYIPPGVHLPHNICMLVGQGSNVFGSLCVD